jgi:hypothetical protein
MSERMSDESFAEFERMAEALTTLGDVICWPPLITEARRAREAEAALRAEVERLEREVALAESVLTYQGKRLERADRRADRLAATLEEIRVGHYPCNAAEGCGAQKIAAAALEEK